MTARHKMRCLMRPIEPSIPLLMDAMTKGNQQ
jgi:hypothetical protein